MEYAIKEGCQWKVFKIYRKSGVYGSCQFGMQWCHPFSIEWNVNGISSDAWELTQIASLGECRQYIILNYMGIFFSSCMPCNIFCLKDDNILLNKLQTSLISPSYLTYLTAMRKMNEEVSSPEAESSSFCFCIVHRIQLCDLFIEAFQSSLANHSGSYLTMALHTM